MPKRHLHVAELTERQSKGELPPALSATQETWVRPLGWENPLQKEMATHSVILATMNTVAGYKHSIRYQSIISL